MSTIKDKVAIVLGAGTAGPTSEIGNGRAISIQLAREGVSVFLVDRDLDSAKKTQKYLINEGGNSRVYRADVTIGSDCNALVQACVAEFGRVDAVVNNVGIEVPGGIDSLSENDWDKTLIVNLKSVFLVCKAVIPQMIATGGGSIVNISSINAVRNLPALSPAYSASKAGMIALTREIALQYARRGIRANTVLPGMMNTPMAENALLDAYGGLSKEMREQRDAMCPPGKQGTAWDTANVVCFLVSDKSNYINATSITVDGGLVGGVCPPD